MRYIQLLPEQVPMLERIRRLSKKPRTRDRALALLLSHQGQSAPKLALFFDVHRNTIINWFNAFERYGWRLDFPRFDGHEVKHHTASVHTLLDSDSPVLNEAVHYCSSADNLGWHESPLPDWQRPVGSPLLRS